SFDCLIVPVCVPIILILIKFKSHFVWKIMQFSCFSCLLFGDWS
ncbi:unnamed protein product, partial [Arabidopsis halleri]